MARDARISEIFYYFETHTNIATGRTVGRKIGVVQEILCKKLLLTSPKIQDGLVYEPKLPGRSGATHKVEFVVLQPLAVFEIELGQSCSLADGIVVVVTRVNPTTQKAVLKIASRRRTVVAGQLLKLSEFSTEESSLRLKIVWVGTDRVRLSVLDSNAPVASIESKRVGAQRFSGTEQLGSGIQTIEKAKQTSLVAVDLDLRFNGTLLAQSTPETKRVFRSFVILGNGVHWTSHDLAVLETYVDYTYQVVDKAVLRYAEFVRDRATAAGEDFFAYFKRYFQGMTRTPADDFVVQQSDFIAIRPKNAVRLLAAVESQIQAYTVSLAEA